MIGMDSPIHIHIHFGTMKPPQASGLGSEEMADESDQDRETRLMRAYTNGGTLTMEEFDFLKRRGCVRY